MLRALAGPGRRDGRDPLADTPDRPRRRTRLVTRAALLGGLLVFLSGCSTKDIPAFGMPDPVTAQGHAVIALWKGAWLAAWVVGILVWGLIGWCIVAYRKRSDQLPPQVHYNLPIEILYTVVPCVIIGILFYFTAVDETNEDKLVKNPYMTVNVVGYQWAWQFTYVGGPANGLSIHGRIGQFPQLVVPTGVPIEFDLTSPDVIHAFWVPEVDFKRDVIPGRTNRFDLTFQKTGTWRGKCTELCGVDHDRMLFTLQAVNPSEFGPWAAASILQAKRPNGNNQFTFSGAAAAPAREFSVRSRS
jgi:cytochrome c oxidase subunit 2